MRLWVETLETRRYEFLSSLVCLMMLESGSLLSGWISQDRTNAVAPGVPGARTGKWPPAIREEVSLGAIMAAVSPPAPCSSVGTELVFRTSVPSDSLPSAHSIAQGR